MRHKQAVRAVVGSRYWRESAARVMVDAWRESGEAVAAFAMRHGVDRRRLARWVRRVATKADVVVPFHPVRVVGAAEGRVTDPPIEIAIGSTYRVRVPPGFQVDALRRVARPRSAETAPPSRAGRSIAGPARRRCRRGRRPVHPRPFARFEPRCRRVRRCRPACGRRGVG